MFSQFKQIRPFTTSLNLNVPIKPPNTPAGHQDFDITRALLSRNLIILRWHTDDAAKNLRNEDVSSNRARIFFFL